MYSKEKKGSNCCKKFITATLNLYKNLLISSAEICEIIYGKQQVSKHKFRTDSNGNYGKINYRAPLIVQLSEMAGNGLNTLLYYTILTCLREKSPAYDAGTTTQSQKDN